MKSQRKKHELKIIKGRIDNHISIPRFLDLHLACVLDHPLHELGRYGTTALLLGGLALVEGIEGARNRRTTYIHCILVFICFKAQNVTSHIRIYLERRGLTCSNVMDGLTSNDSTSGYIMGNKILHSNTRLGFFGNP